LETATLVRRPGGRRPGRRAAWTAAT
jgi:hypothetical protein